MTFTIDDTRLPKRIRSRISVTDKGCWEFTGTRNHGYGMTTVDGKRTRVHRFVWELLVGPIAERLVIDHLCRNKPCCNPAHLEPVEQRVNVLRGESPMALNAKKTHCSKGHEFTPDNLVKRHLPLRKCRTCALDWFSRKTYQYDPDDDWLYLDYDE